MSGKLIDQEEIHKQCLSSDPKERIHGLEELSSFFSLIPDKQQACNDLHTLTNDKYDYVRSIAAETLGYVFSQVSDKQQAWNDLHRLTYDEDSWVRETVAQALGSAFSHMPDKQLAWNDLHRLNNDEDSLVRSIAAEGLCSAFSHMQDKQLAWNDLHRLNNDEESGMRRKAARILGSAFSQVPDKQLAWSDLHRLTYDEDSYVRREVACALGSVFSQVPDKQLAWSDLHKLTNDEDSDVRAYAFHSLGRVSVFKATKTKTEKGYRNELENAIYFFGIVAHDYDYDMVNPSKFCLPFYRSFHTIVFKKQDARKEVNKYLAEAKSEIGRSKSKELLLEAVENLANALTEVQNMENMDLEAMRGKLNSYRKYCDRVEEIMKNTEEIAPFATITLRKGMPILSNHLKELLKEIQEKAKNIYSQSKGTLTEEIAYSVCSQVQKWEIGSQEEMTQMIEGLIETFRLRMPHLPGYDHIFREIEEIRNEKDLVNQYKIVSRLIGLIPMFSSMPDYVVQDIREIKEQTTSISNEVQCLQISVDGLIQSVDKIQNSKGYLDTIQRNLEEIKSDIPEMKEKIDEVLCELYTPLSTTQKLKIAIPIIPLLVSYEQETDVPKFVAENIQELKHLLYKMKDSLKKLC